MDIPCAILVMAFCLPDSRLKMEVIVDGGGSTAVTTIDGVRTSIVLSDAEDPPLPAQLEQRICQGRSCVSYTARYRPEASAVDLLIGSPTGQERFIQLKGPTRQIAALSERISYAYQERGRWIFVPLSAFTIEQQEPF
ncbi:MAG: hypothetical protein C0481_03920 [Phenylobacterium sp.]|uniref:hypothetical protein n=1 Tax=Phenylobacterium sp. TaxID=1871053 RepID=UPI0025D6FD9F|nr:hypothetical protein [Phenylobacterium sp.]MBA4010991.1 hypothetical protein [Phenylobacterium sp.]